MNLNFGLNFTLFLLQVHLMSDDYYDSSDSEEYGGEYDEEYGYYSSSYYSDSDGESYITSDDCG